jgi:hypothetical protein
MRRLKPLFKKKCDESSCETMPSQRMRNKLMIERNGGPAHLPRSHRHDLPNKQLPEGVAESVGGRYREM